MLCPECGTEFDPDRYPRRKRKYCSFACYRVVNNRKRDFRRDMQPERREYKAELARQWRLNMKEKGMCSRCGRVEADEGMKTCSGCREHVNLTRTACANGGTMADYYNLWKEDNGDN